MKKFIGAIVVLMLSTACFAESGWIFKGKDPSTGKLSFVNKDKHQVISYKSEEIPGKMPQEFGANDFSRMGAKMICKDQVNYIEDGKRRASFECTNENGDHQRNVTKYDGVEISVATFTNGAKDSDLEALLKKYNK